MFSILLSPVFAQKIHYKLRAGYNASNVVINGDKFYKAEYGPNSGMTIEAYLKKNFLFQAGLIYSHKGDSYIDKRSEPSSNTFPRFETVSRRVSNILHYLVVPVWIGYGFNDKLHIFVGPQFGYLLSAPLKTRGTETVYPAYYRKSDVSVSTTIEYKPFNCVGFYGGYDYGLSKFMKSILTSSNGEIMGYKYVGSNRTIFLGIFYQGEIITRR